MFTNYLCVADKERELPVVYHLMFKKVGKMVYDDICHISIYSFCHPRAVYISWCNLPCYADRGLTHHEVNRSTKTSPATRWCLISLVISKVWFPRLLMWQVIRQTYHTCESIHATRNVSYLIPWLHRTPGPHAGCCRAVQGQFWTKIVRTRTGPYEFRFPVQGP